MTESQTTDDFFVHLLFVIALQPLIRTRCISQSSCRAEVTTQSQTSNFAPVRHLLPLYYNDKAERHGAPWRI